VLAAGQRQGDEMPTSWRPSCATIADAGPTGFEDPQAE
jgi:hypothetical protein